MFTNPTYLSFPLCHAAVTREYGRILGPVVGKTVHHIKDSVDLANKLRDVTIPPNYSLCSFDLVVMYTNIPQDPTLELVKQRLEADRDLAKRTPIEVNDIMAMIKCDLDLAYFRWDTDFYKQLK